MMAARGGPSPLAEREEGARATWAVPALLRWLAGAAPLDPPLSRSHPLRALAERCERLRVLPQAINRLSSDPEAVGAMPPADVTELALRRVKATAESGRTLHFGCQALGALRDAGIAAAGFKGIAAVGHLHGGRPERGIGDVDVLVSPARAGRALEVLQSAGFRPKASSLTASESIAFARASPGSAGNESISLVTVDGIEVDLHWRLGVCDVEGALSDASCVRVLGHSVPLVRPGLGLLLSAHHALRNDFVPDEVIRDLLDVRGWLGMLSQDRKEAAWAEGEMRRIGLDVARDACAAILADLGVLTGHDAHAEGSRARALADLFRDQAVRPMNTDLVYLCSMRPGLMVLRGLLRGGRGYLRAMRAIEQAHGDAQLPIRARLGRLAADACRSPWRRWAQLRALAAAKGRVAGSRGAPRCADTGDA